MDTIANKTFDEERALYGAEELLVKNCNFDGPADGESALKECRDITVENCFFNLRYPFWHYCRLTIKKSDMTELCRAALWYSSEIDILGSRLHGIKALRECRKVNMSGCDIVSPEFGWSVHGLDMENCTAESEYFMMRSTNLNFLVDTKDAFWHAKNVTIRNSVVKGEYLAWYSENLTFENCKISGTQPLCYCKNLKLVDCEMTDTDLCFERSEVEAVLTAEVASIKNPLSGHIYVPAVGEIIRDIEGADGEVVIQEHKK